jgi:hypothetical protein
MKRGVFFLLAVLCLPAFLLGQEDKKKKAVVVPEKFTDRLVFGGNMGLNFGTVTYIGVAPFVGYRVTDRFIPGVGLSYSYMRMRYQGFSEEAHIYGGSIWARYFIFDNVFLYGEYESLNGEWDPYYAPGKRYNLNSALVGGGYQERFGRLSSYILVLYNITHGYDSPYPSPLVLRVGLGFGM